MRNFLDIFKKKEAPLEGGATPSVQLRQKFGAFKKLLAENQKILEIITDLEEKYAGEYLFDRQYLRARVKELSERVYSLIRELNELSESPYTQLYPVYEQIHQTLSDLLAQRRAIPADPFVLPLKDISLEKEGSVGGKMANLGEIANRLNLPVPPGFAITAQAYKTFILHNQLQEAISGRLDRLDINQLGDLVIVSREIQQLVLEKEVPSQLLEAFKKGYEECIREPGREVPVAVRSSALGEDSRLSFAGQYSTALNVSPDQIALKYKEIIASKFTPRAIFYFLGKGFREEDIAMGVGCLAMIRARVGGVLYTVDPLQPHKKEAVIHAAWGLGKAVVDGSVTPDVYLISKEGDFALRESRIAYKEKMFVMEDQDAIREVPVAPEKREIACLSEAVLRDLVRIALAIENHYHHPQDVEWALDEQNRLFILQSRPLKVFDRRYAQDRVEEAVDPDLHPVLLNTGVMGAPGAGAGPVFLIRQEEDLIDFPLGAVLAARMPSPKFVTVMNRARGIVTDLGGAASHMASLAREFRVPTILNTQEATRVLKTGQVVTVDAHNRKVYQGRVEKILRQEEEKINIFEETSLFILFKQILDQVVPLNLIDPTDPGFLPKNCRTFHDITRFVHQKGTQEMFSLSSASSNSGGKALKIETSLPLEIYLVDLGNCISHPAGGSKVKVEVIHSWPLQALWKGIASMKWPGPKPLDVKGFASVVAQTATAGGEAEKIYSDKSFVLVSEDYMNFNVRLGYHLSTIEAFGDSGETENYIKFIFKGGGATVDRRDRRARLIAAILEKLGFQVNRKTDLVDAGLFHHSREAMEGILTNLGKLTLYTKQLDMVMYNEAIVDWSIEEFFKEHLS
jgi:pyruvate,water dikinase